MRTRADSERRPVALLLVRRLRSLGEWRTGGGSAFFPFSVKLLRPRARAMRLFTSNPLMDRTRSIDRRRTERKKEKDEAKKKQGDYYIIERTAAAAAASV